MKVNINMGHPAWIPVYIVVGLYASVMIGLFMGTLPFKVKCMNYADIYQYDDWRLVGGTCHYKKGDTWKSEYEWGRLK